MIPALFRLTYGTDGGVIFCVSWNSRYTLRSLTGVSGSTVGVVDYRRLKMLPWLRASALIICDIERLSPEAETELSNAIRQWRASASAPLILNAPPAPLRRYALLKKLRALGIQRSNIYRLDDPEAVDSITFPCFIRGENSHNIGEPVPVLLKDRDALMTEIAALKDSGQPLFGKVAIEYEDLQRADGLYEKLSYFRIGERIIPTHKLFGRQWFVKAFDNSLLKEQPDLAEKEREFLTQAPYQDEVKRIFDIAGVEYGRIDFAPRADGGLQVFEINTNPNHPFAKTIAAQRLHSFSKTRSALHAALRDLADKQERVSVSWPKSERMKHWRRRMRRLLKQ